MTMTEALVGVLREGLLLALLLAGPALAGALLAGLVSGLVGVVTQVQDPAVQLVPRIAGVAVGLVVASPWIAGQAASFARHVFAMLPNVGAGA